MVGGGEGRERERERSACNTGLRPTFNTAHIQYRYDPRSLQLSACVKPTSSNSVQV